MLSDDSRGVESPGMAAMMSVLIASHIEEWRPTRSSETMQHHGLGLVVVVVVAAAEWSLLSVRTRANRGSWTPEQPALGSRPQYPPSGVPVAAVILALPNPARSITKKGGVCVRTRGRDGDETTELEWGVGGR